jgi:hypothetical protein
MDFTAFFQLNAVKPFYKEGERMRQFKGWILTTKTNQPHDVMEICLYKTKWAALAELRYMIV